ncbi:unnamed protein product (macronuclear) [Paramecium tetraurelia]|uniref:Nephrocystin-4 n=1 Tax=Paramecium tetraurelia TaxID=5888 RepID=A0EC75_PARTE|nr:uncharacterized protein GSPATT00025628001 [Paramecium tetraurelia]CAK92892.1 unnamed protein product [Paramecium tetraurelia]|eukprot:XP_001460289.1 hypothetical protein (macronuclear) [Paramecium tetraurelia strain d4-2]
MMLHDQISNVGIWLEQLKNGGEFYSRNKINNKELRLQYIVIDKLENLSFPPEIDAYETQLKLRMSATIYDTKTEQFISNTYKSPYLTIFLTDLVNMADNPDEGELNENEIPQKKQTRNQPKLRSGQAITRYQHAAVWVAFIMNKAQYLKEYKLAVEFTLSQYSNKTKLTTTFKTLGYAIIDLSAKITFADLYAGSVRDLTNSFYIREQKQIKPIQVSYKWKNFKHVPTPLMKLIGPFLLFGYDDTVVGLRGTKLPPIVNDLKYLELDEALNLSFPKCKIYIHQIVDLEILNYIKQKQQEIQQVNEKDSDTIKITKAKTKLIPFCHNGWRDVNEFGFENIYILSEIERNEKFIVYTTEKPIRADRIYKDSAVIFQLVYQYDVEVVEIQQDPIEVNVGWFALTPNDCTKANEKLKLQIHGDRKSFNSKKWYAKLTPKSPGEAIITYDFVYFEQKQEKKGNQQNKQKKQLQKLIDPSTLKGRLIELSIKKKNEIKTGLAREENIMRQNKLIADLFTIKQNTTNLITGMINQNSYVQSNTQVLLHEFQGLLEVGIKNFELAKEKYQLEEQRLLNFRKRKEKLDLLQNFLTEDLKHKFDKWQYEQPHHPNLEICYRTTLLDFYLQVGFGHRDLPASRQVQITLEESKTQLNLKITLLLTSYKFVLKINSPIKEDFVLQPIYLFDNYCPTSLLFRIHILGQEDEIKSHKAKNQKEFERWMSDRMYMHLEFKKVIKDQNLANKIAIIEIWNESSITILGRCFVPLFQDSIMFQESSIVCSHYKECDVISYDGNQIIGQLDIGVLVQYTDDEIKTDISFQEKPKEILVVDKPQQDTQRTENEPKSKPIPQPQEYHDIIRIYYSGDEETKVVVNNPIMLNPHFLKYIKTLKIVGDSAVKLDYYNDYEIHFKCSIYDVAETFLVLFDYDRENILQVYRFVIYKCQSITYNDFVGRLCNLNIPYETNLAEKIEVVPANPFLIRPKLDDMPVIKDSLFYIPVQCLAIESYFLTTRFTIQQGDSMETRLIHFKPKDNKVSQLFNLDCPRNQEKQEQVLYQNRSDKAIFLQITSSNSALQLITQTLKLEPYQSAPIQFILKRYGYTKKQQIKLYLTNLECDYKDCLMFKINYY